MAMGEARKLHKQTRQPVLIVGRDGRPMRSDLTNGVPYIIHRPVSANGPYQRLINGPGFRPYIAAKTTEQWTWKKYKPTPAEIVFNPDELAFAEPFRGKVMIEPNVKAIGHTNKAWPDTSWSQLAAKLHDMPLAQCVPDAYMRTLPGALKVVTPTFRQALAVLSVCRAFIGTEGGLMHGAAAVETPGVILWSEFISPEITGYELHRNLRHAGKPCGMRTDCEGCRHSMAAITPDEVVSNLEEILT